MSIREAVDFFSKAAAHRSYPVFDRDSRLLALVSRSDALRWQVEGDLDETSLTEALSDASQPFAYPESPIGEVADLMVET
ncbi:CBS domain-containing protein, partial [Pseudomonas sp. GW531-E2]|uniref:CBS domain-containing protein n=1 Tax=Pseudomonas sp. GW531-E2 TaxID=2070679 RepID=UPI002115088D